MSAVVEATRAWLGTPYHHQASLRGVGCDCLGLVRGVWRDLYGAEPERPPAYTADWAEVGARETLRDAATRHLVPAPLAERRAGDVLLFRWRDGVPAKHCGILTGTDRMIHAQEGVPVSEVALSAWWLRRAVYVFRFPNVRSPVASKD